MSSLLEALSGQVRRSAASPADGNDTAAILVQLAGRSSGSLAREEKTALESLCASVHIFKRLLTTYDGSWRKTAVSEDAGSEMWALLVAVLLSRVPGEEAASREEHGFALKCLNAAFAALDLAPKKCGGAVPHQAALQDQAEQLLNSLGVL